MGKILLVQPLPGIGDMIWYLPVIEALSKRSGKPISIMTKKRSCADILLKDNPYVDEIIWVERPGYHATFKGFRDLSSKLKEKNFSEAWVLHSSIRYQLMTKLAGIKTFGYGKGLRRFVVESPILNKKRKDYQVDDIAMVRHYGLEIPDSHPKFVIDKKVANEVVDEFSKYPHPWIALGVGSSESYKKWDKFDELTKFCIENFSATVFLIGGEDERDEIAQIKQKYPKSVKLINYPLNKLAVLLNECDVFAGNDTGIMNLAASTKCPTIGLLGSSLAVSDIFEDIIYCSPDEITLYDIQGMRDISLEQVAKTISQVLDS